MTDANSSLRKEQEELDERLKSSLWYHVGRLVDEETLKLGVNATPQYIGTLTELVWLQIGTDNSPVRHNRVIPPPPYIMSNGVNRNNIPRPRIIRDPRREIDYNDKRCHVVDQAE